MAPLKAVHGAGVVLTVACIAVPNVHPPISKFLDVGGPTQKPGQLFDNPSEKHFLGGQEWKPVGEVTAQRSAKDAVHASVTRLTHVTVVQNASQQ